MLGWDNAAQDGVFAGNFESTDDGRRFAEVFFDEGCDVIMPVAGPVGLGSAAAAQERGLAVIGVDTDSFVSAPEFADVWLSSVLKNMDVAVFDTIAAAMDGSLTLGDDYLGTLANGGVGLADFHNFDDRVPQELQRRAGGCHPGHRRRQDQHPHRRGRRARRWLSLSRCSPSRQVTDVGGIDDKSFNATAWKGVQRAMEELGVDGVFLESQQQTDYEKNLNEFLSQEKDLIITVGFLLADATKAAAEANPEAKFAIIDSPSSAPNVKGLTLRRSPALLPGRLPGRRHERDRHGLHLRRHQHPAGGRVHDRLPERRQLLQ